MLKHLIINSLTFVLVSLAATGQHFVDIDAGLHGVGESTSRWIDTDRDGDPDALVMGEFFRTDQGNPNQAL